MAVAATSAVDWGGLVNASKTSDKFTGWKSDPKTGQLIKVSAQDADTTTDQLQNRFLTLLVAQLKNQDPNNPLDNAQVTSQMAQLSTVTGIQGLNDTFKSMAAMMSASQAMQAAPLVGKEVAFEGSEINIGAQADSTARLGFVLEKRAELVNVEVKNSAGETVDTINLGSLQAGSNFAEWDGRFTDGRKAPAGTYQFKVAASNSGVAVGAQTLSVAPVVSVTPDGSGAVLQTSIKGDLKLADVKRMF